MKKKSHKRIFLFGGIGNFLFQISHGIELIGLKYDVTLIYLPKRFSFIWSIFGFTVQDEWLELKLLSKELGLKIERLNFIDAVFIFIFFCLRKIGVNKFFDLTLAQQCKSSSKYVVGYFQSSKHQSYETLEYLAKVIANNLKILGKIYNRNVIHFRAGDFDENSYIKKEELKKIKKECGEIIFTTNDKTRLYDYCLDLNLSYAINDSKSSLEDFKFMSTSSTLYLSFSTFSFWSGLICKINNGKIIFPYDKSQLSIFYKNKNLVELFISICK